MLTKQHAIVMWIIWFAQLQAAFMFQFFLADGFSKESNLATPMAGWIWLLCIAPLVLATGIRWLGIPKMAEPNKQLVIMIIGLALCETSVLSSIFLVARDYPQYQIGILMVAVVSIIQFAPSYATPGYKLEER
ncbi:hypothetical protein QEH59_17870 [Coraliomargarita sp. SDUM461004]|uniref:Uncharacterized protein n=1 Tax=Thalassobacterium sedimentorum TaxID=3041258 RepID=A0ABU1APZ6_9BACT|nr:hypothetical protein [Coraliomargarita sp. SDUM461004]MDQ8196308.1 hypothetical protein [Coraliomargarita sp. SDUM461004]